MLNFILIILYCLLFAFLSWRNAKLSLALLIFALPTYLIRFQIFGIPFTLLEVMIWLIFIVWFIKNFKNLTNYFAVNKIDSKIVTAYRWPIILLLLIASVRIEISPNTIGALGIFKAYFLEPIMFFLVFINTIKNKKDLTPIVYALGWSALLISALAIYQKFTGWLIPNEFWAAEATRRVTSFFGYPNAIGLYLGPIIILYAGQLLMSSWSEPCRRQGEAIGSRRHSLGLSRGNNIGLTTFNLLVITASLFSIVFAVSKGAALGVFAGLFFLGILFNKKTRLATVATVITLAVIIFFTPKLSQPLLNEVKLQSMSGQVRTQMWGETWQMLQDNFVFGAGLAGYQQTFDPYHPERYIEVYLYPHNIILNFWSELGLAGLLLFGYLFYNFIRDGWRLLKKERLWALTLMAIMVTIIIHGLVDVPYFKNDLSVMFWLWLGMMEVLKK